MRVSACTYHTYHTYRPLLFPFAHRAARALLHPHFHRPVREQLAAVARLTARKPLVRRRVAHCARTGEAHCALNDDAPYPVTPRGGGARGSAVHLRARCRAEAKRRGVLRDVRRKRSADECVKLVHCKNRFRQRERDGRGARRAEAPEREAARSATREEVPLQAYAAERVPARECNRRAPTRA